MTRLEERLRRALRDGAGRRPADDADWNELASRLARRGRHDIRWRAPMIAAAAVAVIAVTASAVVTGGFGAGHQAANGSAAGVPVPIAPEPGRPSTSATVRMIFVGGRPPAAALRGTFDFPGGITAGGGSRSTDGSPLGYLSLSGGIPNGTTYLWGAVGSSVMQVQINAITPPASGELDPGFSAGPHWTVDSGQGTPWSLPEATDVVWTDLGGGWRGFAVQLPADVTTASVIALNGSGAEIQDRQLDLAADQATDLPLASATGTPPATSPTGPGMSPGPAESSAAGTSTGTASTGIAAGTR